MESEEVVTAINEQPDADPPGLVFKLQTGGPFSPRPQRGMGLSILAE